MDTLKDQYRVIAIPTPIANQVRANRKSPQYGHPAHTEVASGYGPCRHCLRTFHIGAESRILFTYNPFDGVEQVPLPGPIFVHAGLCERYPETAGYPQDMLQHAAVLNAYTKGQRLAAQVLVEASGKHEAIVASLLKCDDVDYIEVRDRKAGCFDFWIERVTFRNSVLPFADE